MKTVLLKLIEAYKIFLSPLVGGQCRFYPTCSDYASTAIKKHGILRAAGLSAWRILRCNPWNDGGVDLVP